MKLDPEERVLLSKEEVKRIEYLCNNPKEISSAMQEYIAVLHKNKFIDR